MKIQPWYSERTILVKASPFDMSSHAAQFLTGPVIVSCYFPLRRGLYLSNKAPRDYIASLSRVREKK